jgi:hypothetical protein
MAGKVLNKIITNGLILCLDAASPSSYPGSGTTWYDLSSGNNNAKLVSGSIDSNSNDNRFYPQFISNNLGYFECTGSGVGSAMPYIEIANNSIFNFGKQPFTIEYWFKKYNNNTYYNSIYGITKWTSQSQGNGEWVLNIGDGTNGTGNNYFLSVSDGTYLYRSYILSNTIQINTWYQLVGIRDGAFLKTYLNGQLKASVSPISVTGNVPFTSDTTLPTTTNKIRINRSNANNPYTSVRASIASAKIYNRALSDQEVLQNFTALKSRFGI